MREQKRGTKGRVGDSKGKGTSEERERGKISASPLSSSIRSCTTHPPKFSVDISKAE